MDGDPRPRLGDGDSPPVLVDIGLAALHLCDVIDLRPDGVAPSERRVAQWVGRIKTWALRYPAEITKHRRGTRVLYDLAELVRVADTRRPRRLQDDHGRL